MTEPSPDPDIPTLDGYVTQDGVNVVVWCAHCKRWHQHGHGGLHEPLGAGNGHRVAHCHDQRSPYHDTGYRIREVRWWNEATERRYLPSKPPTW